MKQATAAVEATSEYVRGEIARKKAVHNKDAAELIKQEHDAYYERAIDSSHAYDDLALHGERDLERVRSPSALHLSHLIAVVAARGLNHSRNKRFSATNTTAILPASCGSIMGETCKDPNSGG